jgi:hypothetical protein
MKDPVFENYCYAQQANSLKMRVNWIVGAVDAHMKKGADKEGVQEYPGKVIQQLKLVIGKLRAKQRA